MNDKNMKELWKSFGSLKNKEYSYKDFGLFEDDESFDHPDHYLDMFRELMSVYDTSGSTRQPSPEEIKQQKRASGLDKLGI